MVICIWCKATVRVQDSFNVLRISATVLEEQTALFQNVMVVVNTFNSLIGRCSSAEDDGHSK